MRVAIVHEMLIKRGGAEKVVESMLRAFPDADIFTLMYDEAEMGSVFPKERIHPQVFRLPSQRAYNLTKNQRFSLPFMAKSVEKLDLSLYDTILVSSSGFAHGLHVPDTAKTLVYYHAPARYLWDWTQEYRRDIGMSRGIKGFLYGMYLKKLRQWDYHAGQKHTHIFANSRTTSDRIQKYFRRDAPVLYPPVETSRFGKTLSTPKPEKNYYIILSALSEFKKIDVALQHFPTESDSELWIIGQGEYRSELEKLAGDNVQFLGAQYGDDLVALVQNSLGLIFPGEEDFGIVPIEVMAAGKPVFALERGGLTETVLPGVTGEFFSNPSGADFTEKFQRFHEKNLAGAYIPETCKKHAETYSEAYFQQTLKKCIDE